ncbi:translation initiation factor IF-2-like [Coturnix japonica]|uniref:translation initiation factor IF-2-like n=1 Tax=Coturnix japonica TaxID=93934 RepID=UPI0013A5D621|nr:translation initiation factor IF-2-like [Coturnix japonica]
MDPSKWAEPPARLSSCRLRAGQHYRSVTELHRTALPFNDHAQPAPAACGRDAERIALICEPIPSILRRLTAQRSGARPGPLRPSDEVDPGAAVGVLRRPRGGGTRPAPQAVIGAAVVVPILGPGHAVPDGELQRGVGAGGGGSQRQVEGEAVGDAVGRPGGLARLRTRTAPRSTAASQRTHSSLTLCCRTRSVKPGPLPGCGWNSGSSGGGGGPNGTGLSSPSAGGFLVLNRSAGRGGAGGGTCGRSASQKCRTEMSSRPSESAKRTVLRREGLCCGAGRRLRSPGVGSDLARRRCVGLGGTAGTVGSRPRGGGGGFSGAASRGADGGSGGGASPSGLQPPLQRSARLP